MTTSTERRLRVMVTDAWDTVALTVPTRTSLAQVKAAALERALGRPTDAAAYAVKYRGGPILDERASVADLGIPDGAPLIVLPARRRPVT